jgi:hypothetical protein
MRSASLSLGGNGVTHNSGPRLTRTTYGNLGAGPSQAHDAPHSGKRRASVWAIAGKITLAFVAIGAAVYLIRRPVEQTESSTTVRAQDIKPPVIESQPAAAAVPTQQQKAAAFLAAMPVARAGAPDGARDVATSDSNAATLIKPAPALTVVPLPRPRPQPR